MKFHGCHFCVCVLMLSAMLALSSETASDLMPGQIQKFLVGDELKDQCIQRDPWLNGNYGVSPWENFGIVLCEFSIFRSFCLQKWCYQCCLEFSDIRMKEDAPRDSPLITLCYFMMLSNDVIRYAVIPLFRLITGHCVCQPVDVYDSYLEWKRKLCLVAFVFTCLAIFQFMCGLGCWNVASLITSYWVVGVWLTLAAEYGEC